MPTYRLQPVRAGRYWWAVFGVTAIVLLLPVIINLAVPDRASATDEVRLGTLGYDWEVPVPDPAGEEVLTCAKSTGSISGHAWDCDGVMLQSIIAEGGTEPDRTLRRMVRALDLFPPAEDAPILREGDARMLIDPEWGTIGLSLEGVDEREDLTMVAVISGRGSQTAPLADAVWRAYTGSPLPGIVREEIRRLENPVTPWGSTGTFNLEGIDV